MEITIFSIFLVLSLLVVALGLFRSEHTELALVGFLFLFLLGANFEWGTIEYKTGVNSTYNYSCLDPCQSGNSSVFLTYQEDRIDYDSFEGGGPLSHVVGYWLMVASIVGFIGVLVGLGKVGWGK